MMDPVDRFAAEAVAALREVASEPGPAAIRWTRDREGLALAGLVQAAFMGSGPFTILVDPSAPAATAGWRERLARSWDLEMVRLTTPTGAATRADGPVAGERLDRVRGRWEPVTVSPFPTQVLGARIDVDADAAGRSIMERGPACSVHRPLLDWDDALLEAWIHRLGVGAPL